MKDTLPDSRLNYTMTPRGSIRGPGGEMWEPVFCPNCGKHGGYVPEKNMKHFFFLCDGCVWTWGASAAEMAIPDEEFFEMVLREQLEKYGRVLSPEELARVLEADDSPLATLIHSSRKGE